MNPHDASSSGHDSNFVALSCQDHFPSNAILDTEGISDSLRRCRERNKIHARKTRERKKLILKSLTSRIEALSAEGRLLRQLIDERYTAGAMLSLAFDTSGSCLPNNLKLSSSICGNIYEEYTHESIDEFDDLTNTESKRSRRTEKYSAIERETKRRERNRIHAKKTRVKKKIFLESSSDIIAKMKEEIRALYQYLLSIDAISTEEFEKALESDAMESKSAYLHNYENGNTDDDKDDDLENDMDMELNFQEHDDMGFNGNGKMSSYSHFTECPFARPGVRREMSRHHEYRFETEGSCTTSEDRVDACPPGPSDLKDDSYEDWSRHLNDAFNELEKLSATNSSPASFQSL